MTDLTYQKTCAIPQLLGELVTAGLVQVSVEGTDGRLFGISPVDGGGTIVHIVGEATAEETATVDAVVEAHVP